jgi:hypothetical protein
MPACTLNVLSLANAVEILMPWKAAKRLDNAGNLRNKTK